MSKEIPYFLRYPLLWIFMVAVLLFHVTSCQDKKGGSATMSAENKSDTIQIKEYLAISKSSYKTSVDTAIFYGEKAYALSKKNDDEVHKYKITAWLMECYIQKGFSDKSLEMAIYCLKHSQETKNKKYELEATIELSKLYAKQFKNHEKSLEYANQGLGLAKKTGDLHMQTEALECLAAVYSDIDDTKSLNYNLEAYEIALQSKDDDLIITMMTILAEAYLNTGDYIKSIHYYRMSLHRMNKHGLSKMDSYTRHNMGNVYSDLNKYDTALIMYKSALISAKNQKQDEIIGLCYSSIANTYKNIKDHPNALLAIDSAISVEMSRGSSERLKYLYLSKSSFANNQKDYKLAYESLRKYKSYNDELNNNEIQNKINLLESAQLQKAKEQELRVEVLETKKFRITTIALLLNSIILAFLIFYIKKQAKLRRELEQEQLRNRLSRDLHDDIGSTLSSINILSRTAQFSLDKTESSKIKTALEKINERSQRLLTNMSDIIWNIKTNNDFLEELVSRMREYAGSILEAKNIDFNFIFPETDKVHKLSMNEKNNLYMIFKEAVNNLAKYSEATFVEISLTILNNQLIMKIQDDGKGFDENNLSHKGGLHNMKYRTEDMKGTISITSIKGTGTSVKLIIPYRG